MRTLTIKIELKEFENKAPGKGAKLLRETLARHIPDILWDSVGRIRHPITNNQIGNWTKGEIV